jgi:hypothetical protein
MWALVRYNKETVHFGVYMGEEGSVYRVVDRVGRCLDPIRSID